MTRCGTCLVVVLAFAPVGVVSAAPPDSAGVTARARAVEGLIDAGKLAEAKRRLAVGGFDPLITATLEGRIALAEEDPARAEKRFERAMELAPKHAPLRILVAHARLAQDEYRGVLAILRSPDLAADDPGIALLLAAAHEGLGDHRQAYESLRVAATKHNDAHGLRRELVMHCARHGLYRTSHRWAETLTPAELSRDVALAVLQWLRGAAGTAGYAQWLAGGFPDDADVQAQLGWALSALGKMRAAGQAFEVATRLGGELAFASAEHYRGAGRHRDALRMNAQVEGDEQRALQRFDILFESGKMARAIATGDRLDRDHGLSARRRYNLAYAHYVLLQYAEASAQARRLKGTDEAGRAARLLQAMGR